MSIHSYLQRLKPTTGRKLLYVSAATALLFVLSFALLNVLYPFKPNVEYAQILLTAEGKPLHSFLNAQDKWRIKTELSEVSADLVAAVVHKEDKYFYYHFGVNPMAVARAFAHNSLAGKKVSGASTITMQVARLLEPKPRTYKNKLIEVFRAIQLEWNYSKEEILALYLNLIPYGGNIEGVRAASLLYFGVEPSQLSLAQSVTLAIIPNRPTSLALGKENEAIAKARNQWLHRFKKEGIFPIENLEEAIQEPLEAYRRNAPKKAPHLAYKIHNESPKVPEIRTTLVNEKQERVTEIAKQYLNRTAQFGVYNSAIVVIDNKTKNIVAYVGNPNFYDNQHAGQVDGTQALRSPGSTLKPFIYGLAIDKGIYTPKTVLYDVPKDFDNYSPQNFDLNFSGEVSVEEALGKSLNVVAVKSLERVGVSNLIHTLEQARFASISRHKHKLGLSLALGGCGVSLFEMAGIYSALSTKGIFKGLNYVKNNNLNARVDSVQLLSASSAYLITEMLSEIDRPDFPDTYVAASSVPKIAWKTGTSYGRRDAWSIGFNPQYTIAVWIGNFDGKGARALTGSGIATPLLFKLFTALQTDGKQKQWFESPETLRERVVCQTTGLPPSRHCHELITDYYIPSVSTIKECTHVRLAFTSVDETMTYCASCLPSAGYKKMGYPYMMPSLVTYYQQRNIPFKKPPPHNPNCGAVAVFGLQKAPQIISPLDGREYLFTDEGNSTETQAQSENQLMLQCHAANDVNEVYWYINDAFLAKAKVKDKVFFNPPKGKVKISCSDSRGRNTNSYITVKFGL